MTLSTHVLDAARGRPAVGVAVRLDRHDSGVAHSDDAGRRPSDSWITVAEGHTDADGRLTDWLPAGVPTAGVHRLTFQTGAYFAGQQVACFHPEVTVTFTVADPDEHYHVPLLLSPFAYSTYRGS
jgi:5-hydroxyisourate hydrolase